MNSEHKTPNPIPTTALVTSFEEAIEAGARLTFPVLAVPLGSEVLGTQAYLFQASGEITEKVVTLLLKEAMPLKGVPTVDFRSVYTNGDSPWKSILALKGPRIDLFYT